MTSKVFPLVCFCIMLCTSVFAQFVATGKVVDNSTGKGMPFVGVRPEGSVHGVYTDLDGKFSIAVSTENTVLLFSYVGYKTAAAQAGDSPLRIKLETSTVDLKEAVVVAGENPAHRIIKLAVANRNNNNPEKSGTFSYRSYNSLIFSMEPDSVLLHDASAVAKLDSSDLKTLAMSKRQHLFMLESISERKFLPPDNDYERIVATRISGFENPDFAVLGTQFQSFSFYNDFVSIFGVDYLSPVSQGSWRKYFFSIQDTLYNGGDTVFQIMFRPGKGKKFEGMKGQIFINSNGYAIQNVNAAPFLRPADEVTFTTTVRQQYEFLEGQRWFPTQLHFDFEPIIAEDDGGDMFSFHGIGRCYIQDVDLGVALRRRDFNHIAVEMDPMATKQPDSLYTTLRNDTLDMKSKNTYVFMDSLFKAEDIERKIKIIGILADGKVPIGKFDWILKGIFDFNDYESFRLNARFGTNDSLSRRVGVIGYLGYGFKDKGYKYGGEFRVKLSPQKRTYLSLAYSNDISQVGNDRKQFSSALGAMDQYYRLFSNLYERRERYELGAFLKPIRYFSTNFYARKETRIGFENYQYARSNTTGGASEIDFTALDNTFDLAEVGIKLRFAFKEKVLKMRNREVGLGTKYPIVLFNFAQGLELEGHGEYAYTRADVSISKKFKSRVWGNLELIAQAGAVAGDFPLSRAHAYQGSFVKNFGLATPAAFETMRVNAFFATHFTSLFFRQQFDTPFWVLRKSEPRLGFTHSATVGRFENATAHRGLEFQTTEKGYFESGMFLDGLYRSGASHMGLGVVYNHGAYAQADRKENYAIKLSVKTIF